MNAPTELTLKLLRTDACVTAIATWVLSRHADLSKLLPAEDAHELEQLLLDWNLSAAEVHDELRRVARGLARERAT